MPVDDTVIFVGTVAEISGPPVVGDILGWQLDEGENLTDPFFEITDYDEETNTITATQLSEGDLPTNGLDILGDSLDAGGYGGSINEWIMTLTEDAYVEETGTPIIRVIDFTYSEDIAYDVELGNLYARIFYDGDLIDSIVTPYLEEHLFELQYKQIGDVMWIVHPSYAQRKLSRVDASNFSLDIIPYNKGPFLIRNDLINPDAISVATMKFSGGILECSGEIFQAGHVGAIFCLWHPKPDKYTELSGNGTSTIVSAKGNITLLTRGMWTGKIIWQRNENNKGWEQHRKYKSSEKAERNIQETYYEEVDNVKFRLHGENLSDTFRGELSVEESYWKGIVKITEIIDEFNAYAYPIIPVASINNTKRWAEGAWSDVQGYPSSLTFFEQRCIFAGQRAIPAQLLTFVEAPE